VHPIDEEYVEVPAIEIHRLDPFRTSSAKGVGRGVWLAEIRFGLDESSAIPCPPVAADEPRPQKIARDSGRGAAIKLTTGFDQIEIRGIESEPRIRREFR
jgi:hypothetical protein